MWLILNFGGLIHILEMAKARDDKRMINHPQKGHSYGHMTDLNYQSPLNISGMAKARDFKLWTLVRHVMV